MSRVNEIIENHESLNQLFSIIKHYGVNAEFVTNALLEQFKQNQENENSDDTKESSTKELIEDLTQFIIRF